jgi:hypothetical protein
MVYRLHTPTRIFNTGAQRALAVALVLVGMTDQLEDACMGSHGAVQTTSHLVFGVLLYAAVLARFYAEIARAGTVPYVVARHLSRQVYVLLYLLFGVKEVTGMAVVMWTDGAAAFPAVEGFQIYLALGLSALICIHFLAARFRSWDAGRG